MHKKILQYIKNIDIWSVKNWTLLNTIGAILLILLETIYYLETTSQALHPWMSIYTFFSQYQGEFNPVIITLESIYFIVLLITVIYIVATYIYWHKATQHLRRTRVHIGNILWIFMYGSIIGYSYFIDTNFAPYILVSKFIIPMIIYGYSISTYKKNIQYATPLYIKIFLYLLWVFWSVTFISYTISLSINANFLFNDWPLMGDTFFPSGYWDTEMSFMNILHNHATVQFNFRILTYTLIPLCAIFLLLAKHSKNPTLYYKIRIGCIAILSQNFATILLIATAMNPYVTIFYQVILLWVLWIFVSIRKII